MANPRIDELRSRLQREPGSRLFAQLAEELRKDGELTEAIRVARSGLAVHPNYPSARLTLGRALIESGNLTAARTELESVLRGAPDNILASRMLAECLEGLGDLGAALLQFRAALRLNPGDRQIEGQIRALELRLASPTPVRPMAPAAAGPPAGVVDATPAAKEGPVTVVDGGATFPSLRAAQTLPTPPPIPPRLETRAAATAPPVPPAVMTVPASAASALPARPEVPRLPPLPPKAPVASPPAPGPPLRAAGDFDDVFEAAPSWQSAGDSGSPAESTTILLVEDEAPTLPGGPFGRPVPLTAPEEAVRGEVRSETAAFPAVLPPEAPVTLSLERPVSPASPPAAASAGHMPAGAETWAGAPAFEPIDEAPPPPPSSSSPFGPPAAIWASAPALESPFPAPVAPAPAAPVVADTPAPVGPSTAEGAPALRSATLAELYLEQGFTDMAVEVYEQVLESDPYDERARSRLIEIKKLAATTPAAVPALPEAVLAMEETKAPPPEALAPSLVDDPHAPRRRALERTIAQLEKMLVAVRRE